MRGNKTCILFLARLLGKRAARKSERMRWVKSTKGHLGFLAFFFGNTHKWLAGMIPHLND